MNTKLYVGNLAATTAERDLQNLFSPHGNVAEIHLPQTRESGQPRGFAIVTMATPQGAQAAILGLNGKVVAARVLAVTEYVPAPKVTVATGQKGKVPVAALGQNVSAFRRLFGVF